MPKLPDCYPLNGRSNTAAGFDIPRCDNIQIEYQPKYERCVYYFEQLTRREGVKLHYKCLDVDAPTGKPLRTYKTDARQ